MRRQRLPHKVLTWQRVSLACHPTTCPASSTILPAVGTPPLRLAPSHSSLGVYLYKPCALTRLCALCVSTCVR